MLQYVAFICRESDGISEQHAAIAHTCVQANCNMLELVRVACLSEHHSATVLIGRLYPSYWNFHKILARKSLSVAEIRTMLAEKFNNISSEYEIEDCNCIPSDDDGEIDEVVPDLDISDEEAESYQIIT